MSDSDSNRSSPQPWNRPSGNTGGPRIGRIGEWSSSSSNNTGSSGRRIATLGDISASSDPHAGHGHPPGRLGDGDDDDDDEGEAGQEFFAGGGERSGVSIQGPPGRGQGGSNVPGGDLVRDLLRRAAAAEPPPEPLSATSNAFTGGGHRLGGEDVETAYIPDPTVATQDANELPTAIRRLSIWRNGFSIEDGELMSYDDPVHAQILQEINTGRATPSILNVANGQPVELRVTRRMNEDYVPSAAVGSGRAFAGQGQRLGSPVPSVVPPTAGHSSSMPGTFPITTASLSSASANAPDSRRGGEATIFEVDRTKPTTTVQLRLADGSRLAWRANLGHTVGDLRAFLNASSPENASRAYTLQTTFPNRVLDDNSKTIQEAGIGGAVVVQRWA